MIPPEASTLLREPRYRPQMQSGTQGRIVSLDGLRGLAALIVINAHIVGAIGMSGWDRLRIFETPLVFLLNGIGSVHIFFVLSGFCLADSALRSAGLREGTQFYIRRFFRIHPPYMFCLLVAWGASFLFVPRAFYPETGLSDWITPYLEIHLRPGQLAEALSFPTTAFGQLPVGWTLQVEVVFSLLMPFMVWISRQTHWSLLVLISLIFVFVPPPHYTLGYALDFSLGIAIFEERDRLGRVFEHARLWLRGSIALLGLVVLAIPVYYIASFAWWAILPCGFASALLVVSAIYFPGLRRFLERRPIAYIGEVSYSMYLLHFSVLLLCAPLLAAPVGVLPALGFLLLVTAISIAIAGLSYRVVELPSIRLGNRLCKAFARRFGVSERLARSAAQS